MQWVLAFCKTLLPLFLFITTGLFLDSAMMAQAWPHNQMLANGFVLLAFFILYWKSTKRLRQMMVFSVIIAVFGECFFSLILEAYTYRKFNVPFYVPFGHAIVFAVVYLFSREGVVKKNRHQLDVGLMVCVIAYSLFFLLFYNDVFGFVLTVLTVWILKDRPRERLFYLTMYIVVAYLELIGTQFLCWAWPDYGFRVLSFLPSANPPSGISFFYFGLDRGAFSFYKRFHPQAWMRLQRLREIA